MCAQVDQLLKAVWTLSSKLTAPGRRSIDKELRDILPTTHLTSKHNLHQSISKESCGSWAHRWINPAVSSCAGLAHPTPLHPPSFHINPLRKQRVRERTLPHPTMEDFNSETDSDYTSYWRDWVSEFLSFFWFHFPTRELLSLWNGRMRSACHALIPLTPRNPDSGLVSACYRDDFRRSRCQVRRLNARDHVSQTKRAGSCLRHKYPTRPYDPFRSFHTSPGTFDIYSYHCSAWSPSSSWSATQPSGFSGSG